MVVKIICLLLSVVSISPVLGINSQEDFLEWLPYDPNYIPISAISLERTLDGKTIYTGRTHLTDGDREGYVPVNIIEGDPCAYGLLDVDVMKVCDNITILIGKNDYLNNLFWYTEEWFLNFLTIFESDEYHPVRIGWEAGADDGVPFNTTLYYARQTISRAFWGGKIATSRPNTDMDYIGCFVYVNENDGEVSATFFGSYDVLVFRY